MTVSDIPTVLKLIEEIPQCRIYSYIHAVNKRAMFAVFTEAKYDDMHESEYVSNPRLLYDNGVYTDLGIDLL